MSFKKLTKVELTSYYKAEIERFKQEGGVGAELNIPILEAKLAEC